ncbi:O-methyltransferase [Streptomyces sp. B1I3]|uniref:O-methyltransferase n=1 Tax=Streptomyces sp. B1I3 TaxID=3042264 RepID=UPI002784577F|nr:O-methyltransferase [Streptomyces sp. B1I3]MDQ0793025.1 putative O-methyltransferase YrrM [Streptomyces sp. B1I3]
MEQKLWSAVDSYFDTVLGDEDPALAAAAQAHMAFDLPDIGVSRPQGKLLHLLARIQGAERILEIGTFGGYSTIWLARALPPGGRLVTIEWERAFAEAAAGHLEQAGVAGVVEQHVGRALDILPTLAKAGGPPFDMVFIDANKPDTPEYFTWALELSRPGGVIVVDNVVLGGAVGEPGDPDGGVRGMRRFHEMVAAEPRVSATSIQTVGGKGYDGFTLALILP